MQPFCCGVADLLVAVMEEGRRVEFCSCNELFIRFDAQVLKKVLSYLSTIIDPRVLKGAA